MNMPTAKKANVVLATPAPVSHRTAEENLGIGYLAAVLEDNGYNVIIIDGWLENLETDIIVSKICAVNDLLFIGFSCYRSNMNKTTEICNLLRRKNLNIPFLVGGYGPTFYSEDFLNAGFDIIAYGEAEETIVEIADFLDKGERNLSQINGIIYRLGAQTIKTPPRNLITDLDSIPFPLRSTMKFSINRKSMVNIVSSRGCQASCIFCSIVAFQKMSVGSKWRQRSIKNFVDELSALYGEGARFFKIVDDSFIEPPRDEYWCKILADEIQNRNLNIRLRGSIRADRITEAIMVQLKRAGFFSFSCGIENGSPTALKRMGKPAKLYENQHALEIFEKLGLYMQAGFILFDPFTTLQEIEENYEFMSRYRNMISKGIFTEMYAAAGTPFSNLLEKKKLVEHNFSSHGNSKYDVQDEVTRKIYNGLKLWHSHHVEIYDKVIDPISAPKALTSKEMSVFYDLFQQVRTLDLDFMRQLIELVKNVATSDEDIIIFTIDAINNNQNWHNSFALEVDKAYEYSNLYYDGVKNPFL